MQSPGNHAAMSFAHRRAERSRSKTAVGVRAFAMTYASNVATHRKLVFDRKFLR
jgi:hypothetical protein